MDYESNPTLTKVIIVLAVLGMIAFCVLIYKGSEQAWKDGTFHLDPPGTRTIDGHLYIISGDWNHESAVHAESCPCKARLEK